MSDKHISLARKFIVGVTGVALTFSAVTAVSAETTEQEQNGASVNEEVQVDDQVTDNTADGSEETPEGDNASEGNEEAEDNNAADENEGTEEDDEAAETKSYIDLLEKPANIDQDYYEEILEAVTALSGKDIINGYAEDNTFRAFNTITRDEVAKIIAKTLELEVTEGADSNFTDVAGSWAEKQGYLAAVEEAELMNGYEGKFDSNDEITRAELAIVLVRAFELENKTNFESTFTDMDDLYEEAVEAITILEANELTQGKGDNKYAPKSNLKRGETAIFLHRILVDLQEEKANSELTIQSVEEQITALDPTSESFADDVEAARAAYDALTEEQQAAVTNNEALVEAESTVELINAVTMTVEDGKVILSTTKSVDGLNTEISLVDSEGNPVNFGTLFSSFVLTTTVGEGEADVNDLYDGIKELNTIPYGGQEGYTLTEGEDQVTELAAELNEEAAAGTYTLKTIVKKGDIILETNSHTIEVAEEGVTEEETPGEEPSTENGTEEEPTEGEQPTDLTQDEINQEETPAENGTEEGTPQV